MKIAVIGGGIFGCTAAIMLDRAGFDVHLIEAKDSILRCASGVNQFRLHEGYHYPRSPETIKECRDGLQSFMDYYGDAVDFEGEHYYSIARDSESQTNAIDYLSVLQANGLKYEIATPEFIHPDFVDLTIRATEGWINVHKLRSLVWEMLVNSGVELHLQATAGNPLEDGFDHVVVACYAAQNEVLSDLNCSPKDYQFETIEKTVIRAPDKFKNKGVVVMDGPYCSLDPYLGTPFHLLGHVREAVLCSNTGITPLSLNVPLNEGIKQDQQGWLIKDEATRFMPELADAEIMGSMFTVRAVLPNQDETDARPTVVSPESDRVTSIFSGKIGTCVEAAHQVVSRVRWKGL